jgi:CubicO group peptidase (beta-lactamase class C family)
MSDTPIGELLNEGCARFAVPGAALGLLRMGERVVECAGTLQVDGSEPVDATTPFHVGSVAKSLAALLVVDAARRGEIDLDVPCAEQSDGLWTDTPRALMAQTTGRQNVLPEMDEDVESFVERVAAMPLVHGPGRFSYCNAGWSVLDLLLRRRSGAGFEQLAIDRFDPTLTFGEPPHSAAGHAVGPDLVIAPVPSVFATSASAAGSRWWASAEQMLDYAAFHLGADQHEFADDDVRLLRQAHAVVPGATVADSWGLGWALWDRGDHHAFGWAGYTGGHRAFLRCFPDQQAALVVLANSAGPLFREPGGSALFDHLLPSLLEELGVPPLGTAERGRSRPVDELVGSYGPVSIAATGADSIDLFAQAMGEELPLHLQRLGGDSFAPGGEPPGSMTIAVDDGLLYMGPFAVPKNE